MDLNDYDDWVDEIWNVRPGLPSLFVMTAGLGGESGEVLDILKKYVDQGEENLDGDHLLEELGDTLYYLVKISRTFGFTLREVADANVKKCNERYGLGREGG